jgi:protein-S-isoprenylcysteine O-methyltransferase Ste14
MDGVVTGLLILALAVWSIRQVAHRVVDHRSRRRPVLYKAKINRVRAWMLYVPQAALCACAALALHAGVDHPARAAAGLLLVTLGSALVIGALVQLRHSYAEELEIRAGYSHVTGGLFRVTAHPMRWGVLIEAAGLAMIASSLVAVGLLMALVALIVARNRDEEVMLATYRRSRAAESA